MGHSHAHSLTKAQHDSLASIGPIRCYNYFRRESFSDALNFLCISSLSSTENLIAESRVIERQIPIIVAIIEITIKLVMTQTKFFQ